MLVILSHFDKMYGGFHLTATAVEAGLVPVEILVAEVPALQAYQLPAVGAHCSERGLVTLLEISRKVQRYSTYRSVDKCTS